MKTLLDNLETCFVKLAECQHSLDQGKNEDKDKYLVYSLFTVSTLLTNVYRY